MALSESKRRVLRAITQNVIEGIIEEKMKRGESPDLKWMNKEGFHFRQKKRKKVAVFFKKVVSIFTRNHKENKPSHPNVVPIKSLKSNK